MRRRECWSCGWTAGTSAHSKQSLDENMTNSLKLHSVGSRRRIHRPIVAASSAQLCLVG